MPQPNKMQYQNLGRSGLKVSKIILGCQSFGDPMYEQWILPEDQALPLLEHAYRIGIRTWDTADVYSHGRSEEIIAKAIKQYQLPREKLVILSKCYFGVTPGDRDANIMTNDGDLVNQVGLSRKHILDAVDRSIARLGTYIDVLQIHRLDRDTPREEIMRALNDVVQSGKVRYIGASSMAAWEFQALQNIADRHGWHKFVSMQNYYHLLYREEENEMIPYCNDSGVSLIPWSPLARGVLARPWYTRDTLREKTDGALAKMIRSTSAKADEEIVNRVEQIAKRMGKSMAQIAIAWSLSKKDVCPISGMNSKERMDEACEACGIKLDASDIQYLEEPYVPKHRIGY